MISGLFFAIAIITHGVRRFREEQLNHEHSDIRIGRWWDFVITFVVPVEAVGLTVWWLVQAVGWSEDALTPFAVDNVGTVLFQFAVVFAILMVMNRWLGRRADGPGAPVSGG